MSHIQLPTIDEGLMQRLEAFSARNEALRGKGQPTLVRAASVPLPVQPTGAATFPAPVAPAAPLSLTDAADERARARSTAKQPISVENLELAEAAERRARAH
jgi:hypothetical protein